MALVSVDWNGRKYRFDMDNPTLAQMTTMRLFTGRNYLPMITEANQGNELCLQACLWLMLAQNGEPCNIEEAPFPAAAGPFAFLRAIDEGEPVGEPEPAGNPQGVEATTPSSTPTPVTSEPDTSTPLHDSGSPQPT